MADKHSSERDTGSRRDIPAAAHPDPDDDVTSELSGLIARAFGNDSEIRKRDAHITSARLVARGASDGDDTLKPGFLLSERYEIIEHVHSGGMSHVYKAIDRRRLPGHSQQAHVAVKMLRRGVSDRDEYRLLLEREASKARSLSHPNIIKIFDFDAHEGQFYLVMEWLQGESLSTLLKRAGGEPLAPTFSWTVIEAVADALQHSHSNGVIHADINPSNIFVTTTHDIKLLDFGVARFADDEQNASEDLTAWVTPSYASPEVLSGSSPVVQDDLFSLACVACRCFAGSHPFDGKLSNVAQRENFKVKPVSVVSDREWSALDRCLAYTRADRPDSASVLLRSHSPANAGASVEAKFTPSPWALLAAVAVAAVLIIGWWSQSDVSPTGDQPAAVTEIAAPSPRDAGAAAASTPPESITVVDSLLALARQSFSAEQLILPANNNARDWYRQALAIDANNQEALAGLRAISGVFVEEASSAIDSGDPRAAASALSTAAEIDASNPAIAMLEELLITRGNAQLTAARLATANGNAEEALAALAQAEQYAHIEPAAIESIRTQLTALNRDEALRNDLAVVDAHIAAGRLLRPVGDNAYEALVPLRDAYGANAALTVASQRLAERLLTSAALASAGADLAEADSLLSAAASLGVLDDEVERVRAVIAAAAATTETTDATPGENAAEPSSAAPDAGTTSVPVDGVGDTAIETIAAIAATGDAVSTGIDTPTPETAREIAGDAQFESDPPIDTVATAVPASPTDEGSLSADADSAAVAALTAAPRRGLITEAELPLTVSGEPETPPQQAVAEAGALEAPAAVAATERNVVNRSAQPRAPRLADLGDAELSLTESGSGPSLRSALQMTAPEQGLAGTGTAESPAATTAGSSAVDRSAQSTAMQLRDLGLTQYAAPKYPQRAKRRGLSGYVDVAFDITPDGRTDAIEILGGEPAGVFEKSATRAIRQWQFEPRDETVRGNITLRFEIAQ